jgi:hypothetical protein
MHGGLIFLAVRFARYGLENPVPKNLRVSILPDTVIHFNILVARVTLASQRGGMLIACGGVHYSQRRERFGCKLDALDLFVDGGNAWRSGVLRRGRRRVVTNTTSVDIMGRMFFDPLGQASQARYSLMGFAETIKIIHSDGFSGGTKRRGCTKPFWPLAGRILIALIFILSGFRKITGALRIRNGNRGVQERSGHAIAARILDSYHQSSGASCYSGTVR